MQPHQGGLSSIFSVVVVAAIEQRILRGYVCRIAQRAGSCGNLLATGIVDVAGYRSAGHVNDAYHVALLAIEFRAAISQI